MPATFSLTLMHTLQRFGVLLINHTHENDFPSVSSSAVLMTGVSFILVPLKRTIFSDEFFWRFASSCVWSQHLRVAYDIYSWPFHVQVISSLTFKTFQQPFKRFQPFCFIFQHEFVSVLAFQLWPFCKLNRLEFWAHFFQSIIS